MKRDSFTRKVKEELVSNSYDSFDRLRALLAAYIRINGSLIIRNKSSLLVSISIINQLVCRQVVSFTFYNIVNSHKADNAVNVE